MKTNSILRKNFILVLVIVCGAFQTANAQVTLNLKLYIEGYYTGGVMRPVLKNSNSSYPNSYDCDYITVNIIDSLTYETVESVQGTLHVDGTCSVTLHDVVPGSRYYIDVCHRNSIQTLSANTIPFVTPVTTYFFNTSAQQAYSFPGNPFPAMKEVATGVWALYSGDLNHDCFMDIFDIPMLFSDMDSAFTGYCCTDLNGDGIVSGPDSVILITNVNVSNQVYCQSPMQMPECDCIGGPAAHGIISGKVYTDKTGNCLFDNSEDFPASNRMVKAKNISNSLTYYAYTDASGIYSFSLPKENTYEISLVNNSSTIESASCTGTDCNSTIVNGRTVHCVNTFPATLRNFFIQEACGATASVYGTWVPGPPFNCGGVTPSRTPCPGSKRKYCVSFDTGPKDVKSGTIFELVIDNTMSFSGAAPSLSGMAGTYVDSQTIRWISSTCTDFTPTHSCTVCLEVNVNSIPAGGKWFTTVRIKSGLDCCAGNEDIPVSFTLQEGNSCSCDPNDKQVSPIGCGPQGLITPQELTYIVRFQNIGAGPAHDIVIVDTLDIDLDTESFKMLTSSHAYSQIEILPANLLVFTFNGIELPARINDEEGSSGYVVFSFLPKTDLPNGTMIDNTSAIYFDDNAPVITNTVINTISTPVECGDSVTLNLKVFIDGYYTGIGQMQPTLFLDEISSDSTACDTITVDLHEANMPYTILQTAKALLHTDGTAEIRFPYSINHFYYIAVRNRNAMETWCSEAVLFNSKIMNFDFTSP